MYRPGTDKDVICAVPGTDEGRWLCRTGHRRGKLVVPYWAQTRDVGHAVLGTDKGRWLCRTGHRRRTSLVPYWAQTRDVGCGANPRYPF